MSLIVNAYDLVPGCIIKTGLRDLAVVEEVLIREPDSETVVVKLWYVNPNDARPDRCMVLTWHYCHTVGVVGFCPWPTDEDQRRTHIDLIAKED